MCVCVRVDFIACSLSISRHQFILYLLFSSRIQDLISFFFFFFSLLFVHQKSIQHSFFLSSLVSFSRKYISIYFNDKNSSFSIIFLLRFLLGFFYFLLVYRLDTFILHSILCSITIALVVLPGLKHRRKNKFSLSFSFFFFFCFFFFFSFFFSLSENFFYSISQTEMPMHSLKMARERERDLFFQFDSTSFFIITVQNKMRLSNVS